VHGEHGADEPAELGADVLDDRLFHERERRLDGAGGVDDEAAALDEDSPHLGNGSGPVGFILTRQGIPVREGTSAEGVAKGGYVLGGTPDEDPDVVLIGTGSELQLAVAAQKILADKGITASVVSMPCVEWFESQPTEYRDSVLPPAVSARVAVEAAVAQSWYKLVGDTGEIVSIEHYGESADDKTLFREFGFTPEAVVAAAERSLDN
jgi:transketolase